MFEAAPVKTGWLAEAEELEADGIVPEEEEPVATADEEAAVDEGVLAPEEGADEAEVVTSERPTLVPPTGGREMG